MRKFLTSCCITALAASFAIAPVSAMAQRAKGVAVQTAYVEEEVVSDTTTTPGAVVAPSAFVLSALRSDEVIVAPLQIGAFVRKGTTIATQNHDDLTVQKALLSLQLDDARAQLGQISANLSYENQLLEVAENQLVLVTQRATRARQLAAKQALSVEAAETAQSAELNAAQQVILRQQSADRLAASFAETERTITRLELQIDQIAKQISEATYKAPENGLILSLPAYQTGFARQGDVIARIQGFRGFEVEAEVPSAYLPFLRAAPTVEAKDGQGNEIALTFRTALPQEDRRTATRPVRFSIDGELPRGASADGARIDIQVPIREAASSLLVPQDAIVPVAGGHVVFVFDDGKAARQIVRLGGGVGDKVVILSGLEAGERVIVKGNEGLADGADIKEGTPPKRKVPNGEAVAEEAPAEVVLETELAEDAVTWTLEWSTPRGDSSAKLQLSSKANLYDGEPIFVTKDGDKIIFDAERVLPFGILVSSFDGVIAGTEMSGTITLSGLPGGRTPSFPFTGKVE